MLECEGCDKNNIPNNTAQCPRCGHGGLRALATATANLGTVQVTTEHVTAARDWVETTTRYEDPTPGSPFMATVTPVGAPVQWIEVGNGNAANLLAAGPNLLHADHTEHTDVQRVATPRVVNFHRPVLAVATLRNTGSQGRATAPPPYSSGQTQPGADIGDLAELNNGHLVAVALGGDDEYRNIVPMVRWMNQSGAWSRLETALSGFVTAAQALNQGAALNLQAQGAVALQRVRVEIEIEYSRWGDPRVPVGFYVRVVRNNTRLAHYWLANDGDPPAAHSLAEEKCWLMAHYALGLIPFATLGDKQTFFAANGGNANQANDPLHDVWTFISALGAVSLAGLPVLQAANALPVPPHAALEWLDSVNLYWNHFAAGPLFPVPPVPNPAFELRPDVNRPLSGANVAAAAPFTAIPLEQVVAYSDFSSTQRSMMRKYNRWRNGGQMESDARAGLYAGEQAELYPALSQSGGRNFPEIDHIHTKLNGGPNSYANARVVSFAHNHIYRDKPTTGTMTLSHANYGAQWPASIPPLADAALDGLRVTANSLYYTVSHMVKARREYLRHRQRAIATYAAENLAVAGYVAIRTLHARGVAQLRLQQTLLERQRLRAAFGNLVLVVH